MERKLTQISEEAYDIEMDAADIWSLLIKDVDVASLQSSEAAEGEGE